MSENEKNNTVSFSDKFKKNSSSEIKKKTADDYKTEKVNATDRNKKSESFEEQMIRSRAGDLCYKVFGTDSTGRQAWYIVMLDPLKKDAFLKHKDGDKYDLLDYGKIVASAYGDTIPDDVKKDLADKYGFDNL